MNAGRHALGWLVAGSAVGLWLSLLLLFPEWQAGEWTYGRWMPVHLDTMLYGWTALPLVAWLLSIYGVSRKWADAAAWAWTAALLAGACAWLAGGSSGKIFLDWKGGPLFAMALAMALLWFLLARAWLVNRARFSPSGLRLRAAGLIVLALVPFAFIRAASPGLYPPVNPSSGGPTGASLLGSTLVVVVLLLLLPRSCRLRGPAAPPWKPIGFLIFSAAVFAVAEARGGSHRDPVQIAALGLLLPWPFVLIGDWRRFDWPDRSRGWCLAVFFWWALLVFSGFAVFLPGILDRLKFTSALVAHSHLAMAGFTTSFCALLLRLLGQRFGREGSVFAWHLAAFGMVVTLAAAGWIESIGNTWMADPAVWRVALFSLRTFFGIVMLGATIHWYLTWHPAPATAELPDSDHETSLDPLEPGSRRDGRDDRSAAGYFSKLGAPPVGGAGDGPSRVSKLDRRIRGIRRLVLRSGPARRGGDRHGVDLHGDGQDSGGDLSGGEGGYGPAPGGLAYGGGGGRHGGGDPVAGIARRLLEGPARLMLPLRAAAVVAMVYAHFLIFAQFAWVELLRAKGSSHPMETVALGAMALAGIVSGFLVARKQASPRLLRLSLAAAGLSSALAPWAASMPFAIAISLLTGAALGAATVSLAPLLPRWCGVAWLGLGTGIGYALCNLPPVFTATPPVQATLAAFFAFAGALFVPRREMPVHVPARIHGDPSMIAAIAAFTALVWLDSAAFFIIQHSFDLRSATWGNAMLWRNAVVHLTVAVLAGGCLRYGFRGLLVAAWIILAIAALAVNSPDTRMLAGWWYPAGVSLYSTALVAWPGFFGGTTDARCIAWRAAWLYAVAGWFGSANGIGMVQSLARVPAEFIYTAGAVIIGAMLFRRRAWPAAVATLGTAVIALVFPPSSSPGADAAARGRGVFVAEGCIHCHSRYVRPASPDETPWGPRVFTAKAMSEKPVLIGNRRQGPDLANIGLRRSPAWLKLHFIDPRSLSPGSPMPSYAHLFRDGRGDDLTAFLLDADPAAHPQRRLQIEAWQPQPCAPLPPAEGLMLFLRHCAACHGPEGHGDGELAGNFPKPPPNLDLGPFVWTPGGPDLETRLARVVKFGIPGTDMPGHETLDDSQIMALTAYLARIRATSMPNPHEIPAN